MAENFGLFFGGIRLLVGLPFLIIGVWQGQTQVQFAEGAETVRGTVLTREIVRASWRSGRSTQFAIAFRPRMVKPMGVASRSV